jgi:hypothetical protein
VQQAAASTPQRAAITGYGPLTFGASFKDVITTLDSDLFNPVSVSECFKDLPLKGCYLSRNSEDIPFEMKEGVPYTLSLSFNKWDKLTDIGLGYDREEDISRADCMQIHERTLDWVSAAYGPMRVSAGGSEGENRYVRGKTRRGNLYEVSSLDGGFFVTSPMRTVSPNSSKAAETRPIPEWDQDRYVSILSTFIVVDGKPICNVDVKFSEPTSVERGVI